MRDVEQQPRKPAEPKPVLDEKQQGLANTDTASEESTSAGSVEATIAELAKIPNDDEINASIDAMRPQETTIEARELKAVTKKLVDGYNIRQLSRYLSQHLPSGIELRSPAAYTRFQITPWQVGQTPLETRLKRAQKNKKRGAAVSKAKVAEQIVRQGWDLSAHSEEQRLGELEIVLLPWQSAMLFDLVVDGKPKHESLLDSTFLSRSASITPYRPDNVVRVTGRRRDAEEIARVLERKLLTVQKLQVDLSTLERVMGKRSIGAVLTKADLSMIGQQTQTVVRPQSSNAYKIHGMQESEVYNARRMLLCMLDLLPVRTAETFTDATGKQALGKQNKKAQASGGSLMPVEVNDGLHYRYRSQQLYRVSAPHARKTLSLDANTTNLSNKEYSAAVPMLGQENATSAGRIAAQASKLAARAFASLKKPPKNSTWQNDETSSWQVHLGLSLQVSADVAAAASSSSSKSTRSGKSDAASGIFAYKVPAAAAVLSYFSSTAAEREGEVSDRTTGNDASQDIPTTRHKQFVAHLIPSPFTGSTAAELAAMPRIQVRVSSSATVDPTKKKYELVDLTAILHEVVLDVPLPNKAVDLRLVKRRQLHARPGSLEQDGHLSTFLNALEDSIMAGGGGASISHETLKVPLPTFQKRSVSEQNSPGHDSNDVEYLLERLEEVQTTDLAPNKDALSIHTLDPAIAALVEGSYEPVQVQIKDVEAGPIHGRWTEVNVIDPSHVPTIEATVVSDSNTNNSDVKKHEKPGRKTEKDVDTADLVTKALILANLVTRATVGDLRPMSAAMNLSEQ